jgi:hypothetical protein
MTLATFGSHASTESLHDDTVPLEDSDVPVLEANNEDDWDLPKEDPTYMEVPGGSGKNNLRLRFTCEYPQGI